MTIRVWGEPEIESRPGQPGTSGAPRGGIKNPAGGAGGAQFDVYGSLSENTRIASAAKLSESTGIRRAVPGSAEASDRPTLIFVYLFDFINLFSIVAPSDFFKNVAFCRLFGAAVLPPSFLLSFEPLRLRTWGEIVKKIALIAATTFVVVSAVPALADPAHLETLRSECASQLNLPAGACDCIAEKAGALSDNQQAFLAATVTKDVATAATLRMQMSIDELTAAGMFMASGAQTCTQGG